VVGLITVGWSGTWKIAIIIAAGVILTTFTDCIGFATLLGLGTLFLL
jgi:hypothetical protein